MPEKKVQDAKKATIDRIMSTQLELRSVGGDPHLRVVDQDQFLQHTNAARGWQWRRCFAKALRLILM